MVGRFSSLQLVVMLLCVSRPALATVKPNEIRTGWGVMYGASRRVAPAGKQSALWLSYDAFNVDIGIFGPDTLKGKWALASIRSEPVKNHGAFLEGGIGWGSVTEREGAPTVETVDSGVGWQAAVGYRFAPSFRMDVKVLGVKGQSFGPWLTLAFNF